MPSFAQPVRRVIPPQLPSSKDAIKAARLVDFETGKSTLRPEHIAFLSDVVSLVSLHDEFLIEFTGFASKLGDEKSNFLLSMNRVAQARGFMVVRDPSIETRTATFFFGEKATGYNAVESDNSAEFRAVEVAVMVRPSKKDPKRKPIPEDDHPIRFSKWQVLVAVGIQESIAPGAVAGISFVIFKMAEPPFTQHTYATFQVGLGVSFEVPRLDKLGKFLKEVLKRTSGSLPAFGPVLTSDAAINFRDLDGATCELHGLSAAVGVGASIARMSIHGKVPFVDKAGRGFGERDFFNEVNVGGVVLGGGGISGSFTGGPLIRIA